jgi:hypothetical protein
VPSSESPPRPPRSRHRDAYAEYYYRRPLGIRELLPAIGVAVGAGLFAFYITRLLLQRTPLRVERGAGRPGPSPKTRKLERSARP